VQKQPREILHVPSLDADLRIVNLTQNKMLSFYVHIDEIQLVDPNGSIHVVQFIKFSQFDENDTVKVLCFDVPPLFHGLKL
jgi:hypothetical protein